MIEHVLLLNTIQKFLDYHWDYHTWSQSTVHSRVSLHTILSQKLHRTVCTLECSFSLMNCFFVSDAVKFCFKSTMTNFTGILSWVFANWEVGIFVMFNIVMNKTHVSFFVTCSSESFFTFFTFNHLKILMVNFLMPDKIPIFCEFHITQVTFIFFYFWNPLFMSLLASVSVLVPFSYIWSPEHFIAFLACSFIKRHEWLLIFMTVLECESSFQFCNICLTKLTPGMNNRL